MDKVSIYCVLIFCCLSCHPDQQIYLSQGIMSGEASDTSIILQSRLSATDQLVHGDIPGISGIARFEVSKTDSFHSSVFSDWIEAQATNDFMVRTSFDDLLPGHKYYYRLHYGREKDKTATSGAGIFKTNPGAKNQADLAMVIVTGMNYYHFHYGNYDSTKAYNGPDKALGYPALKSVLALAPDYFIGTGDNVYFDHPNEQGFKNSLKNHKKPHPGGYDGKEVVDEAGMRRKYHEQFSQQNFKALFAKTATYWEKDDHDYRLNDADPYTDFAISHELGINNFKEQLPVVYPGHKGTTYRTHQLSKDLQLWFLEGRDYRDANEMTDGPTKSLWGKEQLAWLKSSLLQSTATYKILVSPTPMVGPDDAYKRDNHVNPDGFRYEGEAFFDWLIDNGFLDKNFYIVCGDRHWKYHARHPKGIEEFSTGALVDNNARPGRLAGDPQSTDPDGKIIQYYIQGTEEQASGGFLLVKIALDSIAKLQFQFYDEQGKMLYQAIKNPVAEDGQ